MTPNQETVLTDFTNQYEIDWVKASAVLNNASKEFVKEVDGTIQIWAASKNWFLEEWGRDTFIALPGVLLVTGRFEDAKNNIRNFAKHEVNGLIPNRIYNPSHIIYNTADAPMWFIQAMKSYLDYTQDEEFVKEMLPVMKRIIEGYINGTNYEMFNNQHFIGIDPDDYLVKNPPQATWMDADPSGQGTAIVTPRNGKCVEINALWYANLKFLANYEQKYSTVAERVKNSFSDKFWNSDENCLLDVIEGDPHEGAIRPNMLIAISHGEDLLNDERKEGVFKAATTDLLTPGGLRTLSPRDSHYRGNYDTFKPMAEKDFAYHQGTIWPWLIGPYCDSLAIVRSNQGKTEEEISLEIQKIIAPLTKFCLESSFHSLPEVFSGDEPHEPGGTCSQAWSVSEVLRVIFEYVL